MSLRNSRVTFVDPGRGRGPAALAPARPLVGHNVHMPVSQVHLPTALVARYRAVDRETVGSALVDTPRHLDALTVDIGKRGILTPLLLGFNVDFGTLDGNHRIAVAIRLDLKSVPVTLFSEPLTPGLATRSPCFPRIYSSFSAPRDRDSSNAGNRQ